MEQNQQQPEIAVVYEGRVTIPGAPEKKLATQTVGYCLSYGKCRRMIENHLEKNPQHRYKEILNWWALKIGGRYYPIEEKDIPLIDQLTESVPQHEHVAVKFETTEGEQIYLIGSDAVNIQ